MEEQLCEMTDKIGALAGKVWHYLNENGVVSYAALRKNVVSTDYAMPDVALSSALGWLARENKVKLEETGSGRGYRIRVSLLN